MPAVRRSLMPAMLIIGCIFHGAFAMATEGLITLPSSFGQKETDCSVSRNLPVHAELVTAPCEATGTM